MKALIVSDSHGLYDELHELYARHKDDVDIFIHCGDSELSQEDDVIKPYAAVQGNCDFGDDFPTDSVISLDTWSIYVTHGHLFNVKSTSQGLKKSMTASLSTLAAFACQKAASTKHTRSSKNKETRQSLISTHWMGKNYQAGI